MQKPARRAHRKSLKKWFIRNAHKVEKLIKSLPTETVITPDFASNHNKSRTPSDSPGPALSSKPDFDSMECQPTELFKREDEWDLCSVTHTDSTRSNHAKTEFLVTNQIHDQAHPNNPPSESSRREKNAHAKIRPVACLEPELCGDKNQTLLREIKVGKKPKSLRRKSSLTHTNLSPTQTGNHNASNCENHTQRISPQKTQHWDKNHIQQNSEATKLAENLQATWLHESGKDSVEISPVEIPSPTQQLGCITNLVHPRDYRHHNHGPFDMITDLDEGYYEPKMPYSGLPLKRRNWDLIVKPENLKQDPKSKGRSMYEHTQHIMEGRATAMDPDDLLAWVKWVNGAQVFGKLKENTDANWEVTDQQSDLTNETIEDAEQWYKSQRIGKRLRRLRPQHRLYRQVHLYYRNRAPWPTKLLGPSPRNETEVKYVKQWCQHNQLNQVKFNPKTAIAEYVDWWKIQRPTRPYHEQIHGDRCLQKAKDLRQTLNNLRNDSTTIRWLVQCKDDLTSNWQGGLDLECPESCVEMDTIQDWIAKNEKRLEIYTQKYHY